MKTKEMDSRNGISIEKLMIHKLIQKLYQRNLEQTEEQPSIMLSAAVLAAGHAGFEELILKKKEQELIHNINHSLQKLSVPVKDTEGLIFQYTGCGLLALYEQKAEPALKAAIQICRSIDSKALAAGLCFGDIMIGMIGSEGVYMPAVLSETTGLSDFLQHAAHKYSANIIAAGSFIDQIMHFQDKYQHRFLGYLYLRSKKTYEKLYDIFQGDPAEILLLKRKTRLMFEEGVRLFYLFRYESARRHFVEVLKIYQNDNASKQYLKFCDACLKKEANNRKVLYTEVY